MTPPRNLVHSSRSPKPTLPRLPTVLREVHGCLCRVKLCPPCACEGADLPTLTAAPATRPGVYRQAFIVGMLPREPKLLYRGRGKRKPPREEG